MLHQFVKKTDKTPPKELSLARKRMKEWKDADTCAGLRSQRDERDERDGVRSFVITSPCHNPSMARPLRLELAGSLYHVTSRGDGREDICLSDADREDWLGVFAQVCHGTFQYSLHDSESIGKGI